MAFRYQDKKAWSITARSDSDVAGCRETRKPTSGGVLQLGSHTIKTWSSTQSVIALSSGEAEYYGMVKAASQGLGIKAMLRDFGIADDIHVEIKTDSSAA